VHEKVFIYIKSILECNIHFQE